MVVPAFLLIFDRSYQLCLQDWLIIMKAEEEIKVVKILDFSSFSVYLGDMFI